MEVSGLTGYCKQEIQRKMCRLYLRADRLLWRLGGKGKSRDEGPVAGK